MNSSDKKLKVLHIVDCLGGGGVEEWLKSISSLADKDSLSFKVYFCGYVYDDKLFDCSDELRALGIGVIYNGINLSKCRKGFGPLKKVTGKVSLLTQLRRFFIYIFVNLVSFFHLIIILKREKFDIIHVHLYRLFLSGGLAGRLFKIPVVHTVPGLKSQFDSYSPFIYFVYRHFNYLADIFVTGASKEELINYARIPETKIKLIGSFVDLSKVKNVPSEANPVASEFSLNGSFPVVLSVGRLDIEKGHEYSITAVKELLPRFPKIKLIIVGDGIQMDDLRSKISGLGLNGHVVLTGYRKDLENFHSLSDIFLRTSIYEGANMASLLAMAYGKPVIGFDTKAVTEILIDRENGMLVPSRNASKLADSIAELANNKRLRENIGANARGYVYKNCNITDAIKIYENTYYALGNIKEKAKR